MKKLNNNIKNIWILNHYAITPDMPGGTRHYDFAKELTQRGYKITIFASSFHYSQHKELKLTKEEKYKIENIDGLNFVWIKTFPHQKNDWRRVINMISYMWRSYWLGKKITKINKNIKKPDVIIGSSVHLLTVLSAYWLSKHYKAKFTMEIRDLWPQTLIDIGRVKENSPIVKILRLLEKLLYKRAKKIIILSPLTKNYLELLRINQNKIHLIPNGVDISKYNIIKNNKINTTFNIIYTGIIGVFINLKPVLDSAKIIQKKGFENIKFTFVGEGVEKSQLIKIKKDLKLTNVEFLEPISKNKIPGFLATASALLLVTNKVLYGSENKLMDYMASGKPIIFSLFDGHNNITNTVNCGISIPPENPEKMAEAIIKLYNMSAEEREKMGQRGREYVEKYHSIPVLVNKLEKVFREINI